MTNDDDDDGWTDDDTEDDDTIGDDTDDEDTCAEEREGREGAGVDCRGGGVVAAAVVVVVVVVVAEDLAAAVDEGSPPGPAPAGFVNPAEEDDEAPEAGVGDVLEGGLGLSLNCKHLVLYCSSQDSP